MPRFRQSTLSLSQALLRAPNTAAVGSINTFGDQQLAADVEADRLVFDALRSCGAVACASSEETTDMQHLGGSDYSVGRLVEVVCSLRRAACCVGTHLTTTDTLTIQEPVRSCV